MKTFKSFLLGLLVIVSMSGCGLLCKQKQNTDGQNYGTSMKILYEKDFTHAQFDSICVADTLPMDLEQWKPYSSIDYETSQGITEYLFIKSLEKDGEVIYRLIVVDEDTYNIYKRITYVNKEE